MFFMTQDFTKESSVKEFCIAVKSIPKASFTQLVNFCENYNST